MIKAVIVDDESKSIEILRMLVETHCSDVKIEGYAEEVEDAIKLINAKQPDIVFLDIEMSGESGFELLEKVKTKNLHVIFVTAHSQYAVRAFRYSVADYLLKPVDSTELKDAIEKVKLLMKDDQQVSKENIHLAEEEEKLTLRIPLPNRTVSVSMTDIIRLEADGAYTKIFLAGNKQYFVSYNIKIFGEHLDPNLFMRVHRSHIINLKKVTKITGGKQLLAEMTDDSKVEISRRVRLKFLLNMQKLGIAPF
ncbi:MAG TPA: LytTR family DNA-binding domain-containing protein [Bacteroidia bacterium]|nr:LytTR family DNA-binding domain-containing protein [Bacteroidia bacterium]